MSQINKSIDILYLAVKGLMITKNTFVEIKNLIVNHESRPVKSNLVITKKKWKKEKDIFVNEKQE